jgi:hypothetical protein
MSDSTHRRTVTSILCLSLVSLARGFSLPKCRSIHGIRRATHFLSATKDDETREQTEMFQQKLKERSQRCVDFPSFAYKDQSRYDSTKTQAQTFKVDIGTKNQTQLDPDVSLRTAGWSNPTLPIEWGLLQITSSATRTRLLNERAYAKTEPFKQENLSKPPTLQDLSPPLSSAVDTFWIGTTARIINLVAPYIAFPYIIRFLDRFVTMPPEQLDDIVSKFGPGIAILYGTFVSLTLSILYNRQQSIQENVAKESSMVVMVTRDLLSLFRRDQDLAIEAGQCAADHIRTLVRGSRGGELMLVRSVASRFAVC